MNKQSRAIVHLN